MVKGKLKSIYKTNIKVPFGKLIRWKSQRENIGGS